MQDTLSIEKSVTPDLVLPTDTLKPSELSFDKNISKSADHSPKQQKSTLSNFAPEKRQSDTLKSNARMYSPWITGLAIVKFDIDEGQVMEALYPPNSFTKNEQKTICLISFPDSNSFSAEGALKYIIRLRKDFSGESKGVDSVYGYVYFKQSKDPKNPRGYSQKSLVILSQLPFVDFFKNVLETLGKSYFDIENPNSLEFLQTTFEKIALTWKKPQPGEKNEVTLNGIKFFVILSIYL